MCLSQNTREFTSSVYFLRPLTFGQHASKRAKHEGVSKLCKNIFNHEKGNRIKTFHCEIGYGWRPTAGRTQQHNRSIAASRTSLSRCSSPIRAFAKKTRNLIKRTNKQGRPQGSSAGMGGAEGSCRAGACGGAGHQADFDHRTLSSARKKRASRRPGSAHQNH